MKMVRKPRRCKMCKRRQLKPHVPRMNFRDLLVKLGKFVPKSETSCTDYGDTNIAICRPVVGDGGIDCFDAEDRCEQEPNDDGDSSSFWRRRGELGLPAEFLHGQLVNDSMV
jgi:hypothetical protein